MTGVTAYLLIGIATFFREWYRLKMGPQTLNQWVGAAGIVTAWPIALFAEWADAREQQQANDAKMVRLADKTVEVGDDIQNEIDVCAFGLGCGLKFHLDEETTDEVKTVLKQLFEDATADERIPLMRMRLAEAAQEMIKGLDQGFE